MHSIYIISLTASQSSLFVSRRVRGALRAARSCEKAEGRSRVESLDLESENVVYPKWFGTATLNSFFASRADRINVYMYTRVHVHVSMSLNISVVF